MLLSPLDVEQWTSFSLYSLSFCFGSLQDYVEAARTAAINQEIKRILTEVLLKVTAA